MVRTLKIATHHGPVTGVLLMPKLPRSSGILLAHGAGAGQTHPWMALMREKLSNLGFPTLSFNYQYTEGGRKAPDRLPKLVDVHVAAANRFASYTESIVLAGKSMGGRVGGHVAAEDPNLADGVVYLGYPLVAIGKDVARSTEHLQSLAIPQLFISGSRDGMGPNMLVKQVAASVPSGQFVSIESGDHSLVPLKRTGRTLDDALEEACGSIDRWWHAKIQ
ncbi:MAG: dienelactone hydrolase [Actinomycetota bacterium]|nr:dienelactone hydrolase [Actinomycetota bacterium]